MAKKAVVKRHRIDPLSKITVKFKDNPRRPGTTRYKDYERMRRAGTVATFLKGGGKGSSLRSAVKRKHVVLTAPKKKAA